MKTTTRLSLAILAFSAATTGAFAQAGSLDPEFATAGIGLYQPNQNNFIGNKIISLPDSSMLVCGYSIILSSNAFVSHILENGSIDTTFGVSSGTTFLGSGTTASTMAVAPDQSIYVGGYTSYPDSKFLLAHLSATGIPDADFGIDGIVTTAITTGSSVCKDMVIQPDGKLVLGGYGDDEQTTNSDLLFVRYLTDGTLDSTFNNTGIVVVDGGADWEDMSALALMDDGSIVGAGSGNVSSLLIKLNADGTLNTDFGTDGIALPSTGTAYEGAYGMSIHDGSIYVVGYTADEDIIDTDSFIAKLNADGSFDTSFGTNGSTVSDFGVYDMLYGLAIDANGKIVACGAVGDLNLLLTVRYGEDGALDPSFGDGGITTTDLTSSYAELFNVAIQPDGKVVATGHGVVDGFWPLVVVRYLGDGGTVGIADNASAAGQISLYPNPVIGGGTTLELRDANGAQVWKSDLQGRTIGKVMIVEKGIASVKLDVSGLAAGIYLVNVLSQGKLTPLKMQVTR